MLPGLTLKGCVEIKPPCNPADKSSVLQEISTMKIFAAIGIAVIGMLVTGALSESFGPIAMFVLVQTTMGIFWVWGSRSDTDKE